MSTASSNSDEIRRFSVSFSLETNEALETFVADLSDELRRTSKTAVIEHLVKNALAAERGKPYVPFGGLSRAAV